MAYATGTGRRGREAGDTPYLPVTPLTLLAIAIPLLALGMIVVQLVGIERLAAVTRSEALPTAVAQQKRALWTETLRNAAKIVAYAPEREIRNAALAKAEQLAQNLSRVADPGQAEALQAGMDAIRMAARAAHEAQERAARIRGLLGEADSVITDMSANLTSIVEDSGVTLARLINGILVEGAQSRYRQDEIEAVLALNTTSRDLLASLDQGRLLLAAAQTMEAHERLDRAARRFEAITATLRARVGTLRGNSDYEYLPDMIERFTDLAAVFALRAETLVSQTEVLAARREAERALAQLREDLSAEAIAAAEQSVEVIAGNSRSIARRAIGLLILGALSVGLVLAIARRHSRTGLHAEGQPQEQATAGVPFGDLAALVGACLDVLREQRNLERWRDHLATYLDEALGGQGGGQNAGPPGRAGSPGALGQAQRLVEEVRAVTPLMATLGDDEIRQAFERLRAGTPLAAEEGRRALVPLVEQTGRAGASIGLLLARLNGAFGRRSANDDIERDLAAAADQMQGLRQRLTSRLRPVAPPPIEPEAAAPVDAAA